MARGLNKVQIIGNLGADPEMRNTANGTGVTNCRVAVSRNRRGTDGTKVDETEWFRVVAFDSGGYKLAALCNQHLRKGQRVYVEGRLQSRKYTDKYGIERTSVEVVASEMVLLSGRDEDDEPGVDGDGSPRLVASTARMAASDGGDDADNAPF
jgi:single-strand DNA-binding protein